MHEAWLLDVRAAWHSFSTQHDILWIGNLRVYYRPDELAVKCFPDSRRVSWRVRWTSRSEAYWWTHLCFLTWIVFERAPPFSIWSALWSCMNACNAYFPAQAQSCTGTSFWYPSYRSGFLCRSGHGHVLRLGTCHASCAFGRLARGCATRLQIWPRL